MRMEQASNRDELIRRSAGSVDGIIYHTVQFCDNYAYEYAGSRNGWTVRFCCWRQTIRDRAAARCVRGSRRFSSHWTAERKKPERKRKGDGTMYVMGIDSGSTSTNAVIMDQGQKDQGIFRGSYRS